MALFTTDLSYTTRVLRRTPGFTITAVLTVAFCIAAVTMAFAVAYAALLKRLPYRDDGRLVVAAPLAPGVVLDWRSRATSFEALAAFLTWDVDVLGFDRPERVTAAVVTADFFATLGVQPMLGRSFVSGDGAAGERVVILAEGYWRRRFGADASVIGRSLSVDGARCTVIGVMPDRIRFPAPVQLWLAPRHLVPDYPLDP